MFGSGTNPFANRDVLGVVFSGARVETSDGGDIDIRGRAETAGAFSRGVVIFDSTIQTQRAPGAILISGESQGPGIGVDLPNERFESQGSNLVGGPGTSGNIVIRATNGGNGDSINIESNTVIQTTGVVNLRPGGVCCSQRADCGQR